MATVGFQFDGKNPEAERLVDGYVRDYTWRIGETSRAAIRALVVASIRDGVPPLETAVLIRSVVGLDPRRAGALVAFVANLRAQDVPLAQRNRMAERYRKKLLRSRAETIARTEVMGALNAGAEEAWLQAQREGFLPVGAQKEWSITPDEITCPICRPLSGERALVGQPFSNGRQNPPAHPRCRCSPKPVVPPLVGS